MGNDIMNPSPESFDYFKHSEYSDYSEYSEYFKHYKRVEHFESVRLPVKLEGVLSIEIEFNALDCLGR